MEKQKSQESGTQHPDMRTIIMDLSHANDRFSSLFYIFTELWLMYHCRSPWYLERNPTGNTLKVSFSDPKEAILFKLSKQFVTDYGNRPVISSFAICGRAYV